MQRKVFVKLIDSSGMKVAARIGEALREEREEGADAQGWATASTTILAAFLPL